MAILLDSCRVKLEARLDYLSSALTRVQLGKMEARKIDAYSAQEGLVSSLWQAWGEFCRAVIIDSATGAITTSGATTSSNYVALPRAELREVARCCALGRKIVPGKIISGDHAEPTWGDVTKSTKIIVGLNLTNSTQLLSGLGVLTLALDIQKVRNASAHLSSDRISDIKRMQLNYAKTSFRHPSDALFWIEPQTGNISWKIWVDEIRAAAKVMVV